MKVLVVGAGPAGLSIATLLARSGRSHDVTVIERNPAREDPGWGITLRTEALSFLDLDRKLSPQKLEGRACWYRGKVVVDLPYPEGVGNTAIARAALLRALTEGCTAAGARLQFETDGSRLRKSDLDDFDLVVAADGAHSAIRQMYAEVFRPTVAQGRNRYSWLAVEKSFDKLTILLQDGELPLLAWGYKHTDTLSTFIVEVTEETLDRSGLSRLPPDEACKTLGNVFAQELGGASVICHRSVRWQTFPKLSCERLRHRNIVLLGDAAHTTHYSQGYGTAFAFDDASTLSAALESTTNVSDALDQYEAAQQPKIAFLQEKAFGSMRWAESIVEAADSRAEDEIRALIAKRWPNNEVLPAPMGSYGAGLTQ